VVNKDGHRRFGNVRKLPSGRFQASYRGPDGLERTAPFTFAGKREAEQWLTMIEAEIVSGDWFDPVLGDVSLSGYGKRWIRDRKLGVRTRELYESLFRLHIEPILGAVTIGALAKDQGVSPASASAMVWA